MRRWRRWLTLGLILAALAAGMAFRSQLVEGWRLLERLYANREEARRVVEGLGVWGPGAFVALQLLQIVVSPLPGEAAELLGGFLFGPWLGLLYSMVGLTLGSLLAFGIARLFRDLVRRFLERSPWYRRLDRVVEHQGLFVSFLLFLFPGFPKDILCYFLGLTTMPWPAFLVICSLGRLPGAFVLNLQGASVYQGDRWMMALAFGIALIAVVPAWLKREAIYRWMERRGCG